MTFRDLVLAALGLRAAAEIHRALPPAPAANPLHSDAVHSLKNQEAVAYSDFALEARHSVRAARGIQAGEGLRKMVREVEGDSDRLRSIIGEAFKDR